jgi:adenine-specific DNA methylase
VREYMTEGFEHRTIETYFPVIEVNEIAENESTGFGRVHYRPIYSPFHKWWARRLGCVFRSILIYSLADKGIKIKDDEQKKLVNLGQIRNRNGLWKYYAEDVDLGEKIILDPMMGGGTTIGEAIRLGCKVVGGEISPVAWFIVKKMLDPIDPKKIEEAFHEIDKSIGDQIRRFYRTRCPHCGNMAQVIYYFWVKEIPCLNCGNKVPLFDDYRLATSLAQKGHHVICPQCGEIFTVSNYQKKCECPTCNNSFTPSKAGHSDDRYYTCPSPHCGQKGEIIEAIARKGKPSLRMYAIEYYCEPCDKEGNPKLYNGKGYKVPDNFDTKLYQEAEIEFSSLEEALPIPIQSIPVGDKTREPLNHGYKRFRDMFNSRQLLVLGKILDEISKVKYQNLKEFLLLAFSNTTSYNNMFCKYASTNHYITDIFRQHNYAISKCPVEGNAFDSHKERGSFRAFINKVKKAKKYCAHPFERYLRNGKSMKKTFSTPLVGRLAGSFADLRDNCNALLLCDSSEYLPIPDRSVDAVVTDPPYYGNVQYAELSDFFYVWLREILKGYYKFFASDLTPKHGEATKNLSQGRGENNFIESLTRIFAESNKKLRDDGIMVFTFHHKEPRAWASVLRSVLDSDFYVTATYPVNSEMPQSTHIHDQASIEYDTIVVCRKRGSQTEKRSWRSLEDKIYFRASSVIRTLEKEQKRLSRGDIFVITLGKCLEIYSKHYPNVIKDGEKVSVEEAVESIREIVDEQIMSTRLNELAKETDLTTAIYLTYVCGRGRTISFNSLNKELRNRNLDISLLTDAGLLKREGSLLKVLKPQERRQIIESKREDNLIAMDRAHFLYYLYKEGNLLKEMGKWASSKAVTALRVLGSIERNEDYLKLADFVRKKMPEEGLERWV